MNLLFNLKLAFFYYYTYRYSILLYIYTIKLNSPNSFSFNGQEARPDCCNFPYGYVFVFISRVFRFFLCVCVPDVNVKHRLRVVKLTFSPPPVCISNGTQRSVPQRCVVFLRVLEIFSKTSSKKNTNLFLEQEGKR